MPIYEYQGKHYDIATDDPTEAKSKILATLAPPKTAGDYVADFGKGAASLADTALNAVTGTLDMAAYPLANAYYGTMGGLNPQAAAARAQAETTSPKDVIGRGFGITQDPAYQNEISRRAMNAIGKGVAGLAEPIAETTGIPQPSVENMIGMGTVAAGPVVPKVTGAIGRGAEATVQGAKNVAGAAMDVGKGAYGGFTGTTRAPGQPVKPWETPSARQPVGETYIPADVLEQWRRGEITAEQAQAAALPTTNLPQAALRKTGGMVPYAGQEWRALGEQIGSSYRDPVKLIAEAAGDVAFGGLPTTARLGLKGYDLYQGQKAFRQLGEAGFTPISPAEQAALRAGGQRPSSGPVAPTGGPRNPPPGGPTPPIAGPVAPGETPKPISQLAPHDNTLSVEQALGQRIASDPSLAGFDQPYVIPTKLREPVGNFLNEQQKHAIAYGPPGTGKTSLAGEWARKNPDGKIEFLDANTFTPAEFKRLSEKNVGDPTKTLYVIDEADKFNKAQTANLTKLMDTMRQQGRFLATTNDLKKVPDALKTNEFAKIDVSTQPTPGERSAFALNVARDFNVNKTPNEIEAIAQNPAHTSFRDIKRAVSEGYTKKESPMFPAESVASVVKDIPQSLATKLDDFVNNNTAKNVLILDKTVFDEIPNLSSKLDPWLHVASPTFIEKLPATLSRDGAMNTTHRIVIRDAADAANLSKLKGLIERSNEGRNPTNLIIEDRNGKLDPAIISRGEVVYGNSVKKNSTEVMDSLKSDITEKAQKVMGEQYRPPVNQGPVTGPVAPTDLPPSQPISAKPTMEKTQTKTNFEKEYLTHNKYGGQWDHDNKTVTHVGEDMESSAPQLNNTWHKDIIKALPDNIDWEKTIDRWSPDGNNPIAIEWYSDPSKKSSQFKYVENLSLDGLDKLYKFDQFDNLTSDGWKLIAESSPEPVTPAIKKKGK